MKNTLDSEEIAKSLENQRRTIGPLLARCDAALAALKQLSDNLEAEIVKAERKP